METVVIALEELAHYAESTARTMPVTGVVPRAVAEDQIRHALRSLREKRRRLDASAPDGGARWLLDNLWLCEREGASALAAFHAAGRKILSSGTLCIATGIRSIEQRVMRSAPT